MKRLSLIFLFLITSIEVSAQQHEIPFPDSNAVWMMQRNIPPDPADPNQMSDMCYGQYFSHDTSHINGMIYKNLYIDFATSGFDFIFEDMSNYIQLGRFRVDGQKVYYQNLIPAVANINYCYSGYQGGVVEYEEFLMYDFGLAIGDTFELTPYNSVVLETIDSALIDGTYYRKLNFDVVNWYCACNSYYWIEGIGSSLGFFPYFDFFEDQIYFNCFYEDQYNFTYYPNGVSCDYLEVEEIQIEPSKTLVKIVDMTGRKTEEKPNTILFFIYSDGSAEKVFKLEK